MREITRINIVLILVTFCCILFAYAGTPRLEMKKDIELGRKGEMFYWVSSVCEDDEENIYLLDWMACKVRKFSKNGKELLSFGSRGEGPGEFNSPSRIYYLREDGIVVTEMMNKAEVFTKEGKPVRRINLSAHFGMLFYIRYLGNDIFFAEHRKENFARPLVLIDSKGNLINEDLYTGGDWEVRIGDRRYTVSVDELTPQAMVSCYKGWGTAAKSDKYEIKLINSKGKEITVLKRDIPKEKVTKKEEKYFVEKIYNKCKNWPPAIRKKFADKITPHKVYFYKALPTSKYVYVFRVKKETTDENEPYPVDVFDMKGRYIGEVKIPKMPFFMSDTYIYFKETEAKDDDEVIVVKRSSYRLVK